MFQLCFSSMMRVCSGYRRGSSCPKVLAVYGCNGKQMIGDSDLFYKLQSLHTNWSSTSKYFTSISPSWQYGSDSAVPMKMWFHLHDVSVILHNSMTSKWKCCVCKRNNTYIYIYIFFFSASIHRNSACESKFNFVLLFFCVNPSIIIILASLIYTRAADFYVNRTVKWSCYLQ